MTQKNKQNSLDLERTLDVELRDDWANAPRDGQPILAKFKNELVVTDPEAHQNGFRSKYAIIHCPDVNFGWFAHKDKDGERPFGGWSDHAFEGFALLPQEQVA